MTSRRHIERLERWVAPGVCLLARTEVSNRGPIGHIANRLMSPSGIWLYVHENQATLIDAPFAREDSSPAIEQISGFLRKHDLQLKYVSASHLHLDHSAGLTSVLDHFADATFVYPSRWQQHWNAVSVDRIKCGLQPAMGRQWNRSPQVAYDEYFATGLAGEPLYLMAAPYHSLTDQLVIFRGLALLPDWHLPLQLDEPLKLVDAPAHHVADTLIRLRRFQRDTGYRIDRSCAVHGDESVRSDFQDRQRERSHQKMVRCRNHRFGTPSDSTVSQNRASDHFLWTGSVATVALASMELVLMERHCFRIRGLTKNELHFVIQHVGRLGISTGSSNSC